LVAGPPNQAAATFAKSFTERYPAIAAVSPVYAELRNIIDLAICAAWLRRADVTERVGWSAEVLCNEEQLAVEKMSVPKKVACVANAAWTGNRLLVPAGGGVSISPDEALTADNLLPPDQGLSQRWSSIQAGRRTERWWWD
jgi:hypothetical protein